MSRGNEISSPYIDNIYQVCIGDLILSWLCYKVYNAFPESMGRGKKGGKA
jgi:hypothetical protein